MGGRGLPQPMRARISRPMRRRVGVILGEIFAKAGRGAMQLRPAERLIVGDFAGRGLEQRRSGEKDLRAAPHHDDIIRETGLIGAARGRGPVHDRNDGNPGRRQPRHVGEGRAAANEHLRLQHQIGAGALDQLHVGQLLGERDLLGADRFLDSHRVGRAALDPRIVGGDHRPNPGDEADTGDQTAAIDVLGSVVLVHAEAA